eukprot:1827975-Rhodomonas_salina.2
MPSIEPRMPRALFKGRPPEALRNRGVRCKRGVRCNDTLDLRRHSATLHGTYGTSAGLLCLRHKLGEIPQPALCVNRSQLLANVRPSLLTLAQHKSISVTISSTTHTVPNRPHGPGQTHSADLSKTRADNHAPNTPTDCRNA